MVASAGSASSGVPAPAAAPEGGKLQQISPETSRLLRLCWWGPNLRLDRDHWARQPEPPPNPGQATFPVSGYDRTKCPVNRPQLWDLFARLKSAAGYVTSNSTTTGEGNRFAQFSGGGLKAKLALVGRRFELSLREEQPPGRVLEFCEDGQGLLRISISGRAGHPAFLMAQGASGRFRVTDVGGGCDLNAEADSFLAFYRENRRYVGQRLVPLLEQMGMQVPLGHYSDPVKRAVLARIRASLLARLRAQGQKLIRLLNDDSYAERQRATQALSDQFDRYGGLVYLAFTDPSQPPEARERLRKIVRSHPQRTWMERLISSLKLMEDPAYLVELLRQAAPGDRAAIASMLERITGQRLGRDAGVWLRWLARQAAGSRPKARPN